MSTITSRLAKLESVGAAATRTATAWQLANALTADELYRLRDILQLIDSVGIKAVSDEDLMFWEACHRRAIARTEP